MVVCTIASGNYVHKAAHMAATVRMHHPEAWIALCLVERTPARWIQQLPMFDEVVCAATIGIEDFGRFAFDHFIVELSTAVKPAWLHRFIATRPDEAIYYLDPDMEVHGPMRECEEALESAHVVVTPHHLDDVTSEQDVIERVIPVLQCGTYNLGFVACRATEAAEAFVLWWHSKLMRFCRMEPSRGLYVDQKWIDLAVGLFPIHVLREPGDNTAWWNAAERRIEERNEGYFVANRPLRVLHFSQLDLGRDRYHFARAAPEGNEPIHKLRSAYQAATDGGPFGHHRTEACTFDEFYSGEKVARETRLIVRRRPMLLAGCADPYAESNEYFAAAVG